MAVSSSNYKGIHYDLPGQRFKAHILQACVQCVCWYRFAVSHEPLIHHYVDKCLIFLWHNYVYWWKCHTRVSNLMVWDMPWAQMAGAGLVHNSHIATRSFTYNADSSTVIFRFMSTFVRLVEEPFCPLQVANVERGCQMLMNPEVGEKQSCGHWRKGKWGMWVLFSARSKNVCRDSCRLDGRLKSMLASAKPCSWRQNKTQQRSTEKYGREKNKNKALRVWTFTQTAGHSSYWLYQRFTCKV